MPIFQPDKVQVLQPNYRIGLGTELLHEGAKAGLGLLSNYAGREMGLRPQDDYYATQNDALKAQEYMKNRAYLIQFANDKNIPIEKRAAAVSVMAPKLGHPDLADINSPAYTENNIERLQRGGQDLAWQASGMASGTPDASTAPGVTAPPTPTSPPAATDPTQQQPSVAPTPPSPLPAKAPDPYSPVQPSLVSAAQNQQKPPAALPVQPPAQQPPQQAAAQQPASQQPVAQQVPPTPPMTIPPAAAATPKPLAQDPMQQAVLANRMAKLNSALMYSEAVLSGKPLDANQTAQMIGTMGMTDRAVAEVQAQAQYMAGVNPDGVNLYKEALPMAMLARYSSVPGQEALAKMKGWKPEQVREQIKAWEDQVQAFRDSNPAPWKFAATQGLAAKMMNVNPEMEATYQTHDKQIKYQYQALAAEKEHRAATLKVEQDRLKLARDQFVEEQTMNPAKRDLMVAQAKHYESEANRVLVDQRIAMSREAREEYASLAKMRYDTFQCASQAAVRQQQENINKASVIIRDNQERDANFDKNWVQNQLNAITVRNSAVYSRFQSHPQDLLAAANDPKVSKNDREAMQQAAVYFQALSDHNEAKKLNNIQIREIFKKDIDDETRKLLAQGLTDQTEIYTKAKDTVLNKQKAEMAGLATDLIKKDPNKIAAAAGPMSTHLLATLPDATFVGGKLHASLPDKYVQGAMIAANDMRLHGIPANMYEGENGFQRLSDDKFFASAGGKTLRELIPQDGERRAVVNAILHWRGMMK